MIRYACLVWLLCLSSVSLGAGSFRPEIELAPILEQVPAIKQFIASSLELAESGSANRIGVAVNARLGGRRIGPYVIHAKPKGDAGAYVFDVTIHTEQRYISETGEPTELPTAYDVRETFRGLELKLLK